MVDKWHSMHDGKRKRRKELTVTVTFGGIVQDAKASSLNKKHGQADTQREKEMYCCCAVVRDLCVNLLKLDFGIAIQELTPDGNILTLCTSSKRFRHTEECL